MRKFYVFISACFFYFVSTQSVIAFDSDYVHLEINEYAAEQSRLYLFIQEQLGFSSGLDKLINNISISNWIANGGRKEDNGIRWFNHFHDPLQPYENAGLWGIPNSSLVWAQNDQSNDASWNRARQLFYDALTTGSEESYANLFLTLGQLTHLVSDKAVPAHIRDDAHPETQLYKIWKITHFEVWTKKHHDDVTLMDYSNGIRPDPAIFNNYQSSLLAPSPIARLWDTNQYLGNNLEVTLNNNIGLAEFTNANFFSEDTVFSSKYPHPHYDDLIRTKTKIPDPLADPPDPAKTVDREYWIRPATSNMPSYRASGVGYNTYHLDELYIDGFKKFETFPPLDKYVFQDYASILVPRAVGYSAALIDYFFRGRILVEQPSFVINPDGSIIGINGLQVQNVTSIDNGQTIEPFGPIAPELPGKLDLVYYYTPTGESTPVYHVLKDVYEITSVNNPINNDGLSIGPVAFRENEYIPSDIAPEDITLMLVFKGKLGSEESAVAVQVFTGKLLPRSRIAYGYQPGGQPNTSNIFTISPDGTDPYQITNASEPNPWYFSPAWSLDGTKMVFEKERCIDPNPNNQFCPAEFHLRDIVGIDLLSEAKYPDNVLFERNFNGDSVANASFSPDGTMVAALKRNESGWYYYGSLVVFDLVNNSKWIVNADDDPEITSLHGSAPAWSPAGDKIAYYLNSQYDEVRKTMQFEGDLFLIDPLSGEKTRLTNDDFNNTQPSWSPDGEWIAFSSDRDGEASMDIWLMDKNGENLARLVDCTPASCYSPTFSPDGQTVAFSNGSTIYSVGINGDPYSLKEVAYLGQYISGITWSPTLMPPSFLNVQLEPTAIFAGGSTVLSWQTDRATEVLIQGIAGEQPVSGSIILSPMSTTTYTLTANGPTGTTQTAVTVTVE